MTDQNGKGPLKVHPFLKIFAAFWAPGARDSSGSSDELQKQILGHGADNLAMAKAVADKIEKVFSMKVEPSIRIVGGEEAKIDHPFLRPAPPPKPQLHYEDVNDMLKQLLDGKWKISVRPLLGDTSTSIENYIARKADGRDYAFKIIAWSLVDPRVCLTITFSVFEILQCARFECDSEKCGFRPEVTTCSADPLLDLCHVVIAGKLDRYTHSDPEGSD